MNWRERAGASGPTEVYIPARVFGPNPCVELSGEGAGRRPLVRDQALRLEPVGKGERRLTVR